MQLDFDPKIISYEALIDVFWASHNPLSGSYSAQYKSAVYVHSEAQREANEAAKSAIERTHPIFKGRIQTEILPLKIFYLAEEYHQKYKLKRHNALVAELLQYYPSVDALTHSTAAARLNGLVGGFGETPTTQDELLLLGLQRPAAIRELPQRQKRRAL